METIEINKDCWELLNTILNQRIMENYNNGNHSAHVAYGSVKDMLDYAINGDYVCLEQYKH